MLYGDGIHDDTFDGGIENLGGTTNDDLVSLTTYDEPHAEVTLGRGAVCGNMTFRNIHRHQEKSTQSPLFSIVDGYSIERLMLDNVTQTLGEGATAPLWENDGTVNEIIERDSFIQEEN